MFALSKNAFNAKAIAIIVTRKNQTLMNASAFNLVSIIKIPIAIIKEKIMLPGRVLKMHSKYSE